MSRHENDDYVTVQPAARGFLVVVMTCVNRTEEEYAVSNHYTPMRRDTRELADAAAKERAAILRLEVR